MKSNEFKCAICGEVFNKKWSDEEALAEKATMPYADIPLAECSVICEVCFQKVRKERGF